MRILVIGGSRFLGRYFVAAALARGHQVTTFNRGRTNPGLFPDVEELHGDRGAQLEILKGRQWDALVDTCGYVSSDVRATATLLADSVEHYTFISSLSVYSDFSRPGMDESGAVRKFIGSVEDADDAESYGARKALCEQTVEQIMPNRTLTIRAGLIVGPHDYVDRFAYWVGRVAEGGEVLAPGRPDHPLQLIDVRDLAEWNLHMIEGGCTGVYNATGPDHTLTMGKMIEVCRDVSGSGASISWVGDAFLLEQGVTPWSEIPFWAPGQDFAGFFSIDCSKALRAGLRFRPLNETVRDTLAWLKFRDPEAQEPKRALVLAQGQIGLLKERERELLRAWSERERSLPKGV